jgi:hypothetical protein
MNTKVTTAIAFVLGAALGTVASWRLLKKKYERIAQEEIESVKEYLGGKVLHTDKVVITPLPEKYMPDDRVETVTNEIDILKNKVENLGYTNYSNIKKEEKKEDQNMSEPYVIKPEEFGENDYETESLTHYADGTLTDDWDNPIENVADIVGEDYAEHFGEYEDDSVFIRNDRYKVDYEILYDTRKFSEIETRP